METQEVREAIIPAMKPVVRRRSGCAFRRIARLEGHVLFTSNAEVTFDGTSAHGASLKSEHKNATIQIKYEVT